MSLFDEKIRQQLKDIFKNLKDPVTIAFFTQEFECRACMDAHAFVEEISTLTDKIKLKVYDFQKDKKTADSFGVDKIPALVINDKDNTYRGIKFYGLPGGYEINSFIQSLIEVSGAGQPLPEAISSSIKAVNKDVHIQVYVTLSCPYCPTAVSIAHRLALENVRIRSDMIDSALFPHLVQRYKVSSVPMIIFNETHAIVGAQPVESFLDTIKNI
jgi:glutaredoxin-like protein